MKQMSFLEELMAAGRGVFGLLIGDRQAGRYFDFSRRGLVGSYIAFLIVAAIGTYLPILVSKEHDSAIVGVAQLAIIYGIQVGCAAIVLRQIKRLGALVPYLIADNWADFFLTLVLGAILAAGIGSDIVTIVFGIVLIIVEVNIGRIVMGLAPLQIAMLIVARIVGALIAVGIIFLTFPVPPDVAAQLASLGQ